MSRLRLFSDSIGFVDYSGLGIFLLIFLDTFELTFILSFYMFGIHLLLAVLCSVWLGKGGCFSSLVDLRYLSWPSLGLGRDTRYPELSLVAQDIVMT